MPKPNRLIVDLKSLAIKNKKTKFLVREGQFGAVYVMSLAPKEIVKCEIHLNTDQEITVHQGELVVYIENEYNRVPEGASIYIDAYTAHQLENPHKTRDVKFHTIYTNKDHEAETIPCQIVKV
jgi:quercetin dioxygenase-like cupin family protein